MSLTSALGNALSGLRFTSTATALTSANIANAGNPAYTRKTISPVQMLTGEAVSGVAVASITREYDAFVQRQLIAERANGGYASTRSQFLSRLDQMFGAPGSARALDTVLNEFSASFQTLATSPESQTARAGVINAATVAAQTLRGLSDSVQAMRLDAEKGLGEATARLNSLLADLSKTNDRLKIAFDDEARVGLLDQRDSLVDEISQYVDLRVTYSSTGAAQLHGNGFTLLGAGTPPTLSFDGHDILGPGNSYDTDPAKRSVGTITAHTASGPVDLIAAGMFKSGSIAALIELRDKSLPAAQEQLDQIAAGLVQSLGTSASATPVTAAGPGPTTGYDTPLGAGLLDGDTVTLELTANGVTQKITFKRVDDTSVPMSDDMTADPNDIVFRLTGSSAAGHAGQMQAAIDAWAAGVGAPAGAFGITTGAGALRVLADPAVAGGASVGRAVANVTAQSLSGGDGAMPFFIDNTAAGGLYSDRITAAGAQSVGLAARLDVNAALKADPGALVRMDASTPESDSTRPAFFVAALAATGRYYQPAGGLGTAANPFQGSVLSYARAAVTAQTNEAATAQKIAEGQTTLVTQLQARFDSVAAVNIDQEMTLLVQLQTSYAANARIMTAVREMLDILRQM